MRSRKHYIQTRLLPLRAPRKERATLLLHLSKDMPTMRTLIPRIHLLPMLAPLTWGLTLSLVVTLVSKVPHLMHFLLHLLQEQPRPSMADEFATNIFGDPNPGMASSSHTSLHHSTMPPFFDSSMYTGLGSHWAAQHDYAPSDDQ
jgi:hypothetical protein